MSQFIEIQNIRSIDLDEKLGFIALYYEIRIPNILTARIGDRLLTRFRIILTFLKRNVSIVMLKLLLLQIRREIFQIVFKNINKTYLANKKVVFENEWSMENAV